jgi:hypothetical protein
MLRLEDNDQQTEVHSRPAMSEKKRHAGQSDLDIYHQRQITTSRDVDFERKVLNPWRMKFDQSKYRIAELLVTVRYLIGTPIVDMC